MYGGCPLGPCAGAGRLDNGAGGPGSFPGRQRRVASPCERARFAGAPSLAFLDPPSAGRPFRPDKRPKSRARSEADARLARRFGRRRRRNRTKSGFKQAKIALPSVDRSRKGDPFIGLRPGFDARLNRHSAPNIGRASKTPTTDGDPAFGDFLAPSPPTPASDPSAAGVEPTQSTAASVERAKSFSDGATPGVPLEMALNSATPAPNDGALIIVAVKAAPENDAGAQGRRRRPRLRRAHRSQGFRAPAGAASPKRSILKRGANPRKARRRWRRSCSTACAAAIIPANVCGVVYQDRNRPFACQFSFACEGRSLRIEEPGPWAVAVRIAKDVASGALYNPLVGEAVNYHANYVMPYWASALQRVDRIGHHIFYKVRVGQN